jgi:hypothetical protein
MSNINDLFEKKLQVILYGPPGTGKTYNTKKVALKIIGEIEFELDSFSYNTSSSEKDDLITNILNNPLSKKIREFLMSLDDIEEHPRTSMAGYYSLSNVSNNMVGLVWIEYPDKKIGNIKVHLRKENNGRYPQELKNILSSFIENGWGGYPEFKIENEDDANTAIKLIEYAYENF